MTLCFLSSASLFAALPEPMQQALNQANISTNDVSLIIIPVDNSPYDINTNAVRTTSTKTYSTNDGIQVDPTPSLLSTILLTNMPIVDEVKDVAKVSRGSNSTDMNGTGVSTHLANNVQQRLSSPIQHNPYTLRTPASTMKLITTFIALDLLGRDFKWVTHVYHTGYVLNETLYGDLVIKGSGDPKLTHSRLESLLSKVNEAGIRHINGNIILDTSVFKAVSKDPAAFDNEPLRSYNASPDGFLVNFNSIEITAVLKPDDRTSANVYYVPNMADYKLPSEIPTRSGSCGNLRKKIAPNWQQEGLAFGMALPVSCGPSKTMYIAHPDAKVFAAYVTKQKWQLLGNTLKGEVISTEAPSQTNFGLYTDKGSFKLGSGNNNGMPTATLPILTTASPLPIVSYPSLPLSDQIYDINHYSNNVMTEQVLLSLPFHDILSQASPIDLTDTKEATVSYNTKPVIPPLALLNMPASSYETALYSVDKWWQTHLTTTTPHLTNGSGLCRHCKVSADNLAELLGYAYHHPEFSTYASSMGIAGVSGTIKGHKVRMPSSAAIGKAFIKTGTLDNVTSMAGYVQGQSGQDYIVVGIINTVGKLNTTRARYALDTMLDWTARQ